MRPSINYASARDDSRPFVLIHTYEAFETILENFTTMNNYEYMDHRES